VRVRHGGGASQGRRASSPYRTIENDEDAGVIDANVGVDTREDDDGDGRPIRS
jgi:hypothetical protein